MNLREKRGPLGKTGRVCLRADWRGREPAAFDSTVSSAGRSPVADVPSCAGMVLGPGCPISAALGRKRSGGVECLHSCSSTVSFLPQTSQNLAPSSSFLPQLSQNKASGKGKEPVDSVFELLTLSATEVAGIHASTMILSRVGVPLLRFHPHSSHRRSIGQAIGLTAYSPQRAALFLRSRRKPW
jgi:hypothetical protein